MLTVDEVRKTIGRVFKGRRCLIDQDTELPVLHRYAAQLAPGQVYFEVGTHNGCSAMMAALSSPPGVQVWTIDSAQVDSVDYIMRILRLCIECGVHRDVHFYPLASDEMPWVSGIDFLFIDGGHSAEAVNFDVEKWTLFVPPGSVVAFHDAVTSHHAAAYRSVKNAVAGMLATGDWSREEGGGSIVVLRRK